MTRKAAVLRADGEAQAIQTVFAAIHSGDPDSKLLAYQYLQTLPKLAEGEANKLWIIPSEFTEALKGIGEGFFAPRATPPAQVARQASPVLLPRSPAGARAPRARDRRAGEHAAGVPARRSRSG